RRRSRGRAESLRRSLWSEVVARILLNRKQTWFRCQPLGPLPQCFATCFVSADAHKKGRCLHSALLFYVRLDPILHRLAGSNRSGQAVVVVAIIFVPQRQA